MKHTILFFGVLCLSLSTLFANTIIVSQDIGFDATDATPFLQTAINDTNADTMIIDNVGSDWITAPLFVERSNLTIIVESGVTLIAKSGSYDIYDPMIRVVDQSNIVIIGYGATMKMRKAEYAALADSEYRHVISLQSAINVRVEGLRLEDSGGDGLYIGNSFRPDSPQNYCENVLVRNCFMTNNYRQGISIISAKDVVIEHCEISETKGTLPEAGIDIEPDQIDHRIENLTIRDCRIFNNYGQAIQFAFLYNSDASRDISVLVEDTYMANNHDPSNEYAYTEMAFTDNYGNGVDGTVTLRNCYVAESQWGAIFVEKTIESFDVFVENCVFKNVSQNPIAFNAPIFIEVKSNAIPFGGITFTDCTIIYDADIPFLNSYADPGTAGFADINGSFYVVNPNTVNFAINGNASNVNIQPTYFTQMPSITAAIQSVALKDSETLDYLLFEVESETSAAPFPFALEYNYMGSSTMKDDYYFSPRYDILPKNAITVTHPIFYRKENEIEGVEDLNITLQAADCYTISSDNTAVMEVSDTGLKALQLQTPSASITTNQTTIEEETFSLQSPFIESSKQPTPTSVVCYPNPASSVLYFKSVEDKTIESVQIINAQGQVVFRGPIRANQLDIHSLPNGIYSLQFMFVDDISMNSQLFRVLRE